MEEHKIVIDYFTEKYDILNKKYKEKINEKLTLGRQLNEVEQEKKNIELELDQIRTALKYLGVKNV